MADSYYYIFELTNGNEVRKYFLNQALTNSNRDNIRRSARLLITGDLIKNNKNLYSYKVKASIVPYRAIKANLKDYIFIDADPIPAMEPQMSSELIKRPYDEEKDMKRKYHKYKSKK